ncbi:uncharacterized protein LOC142241482 [Haematobia irritans]|uniref:uncharacterized protein LOC142241482 n=1 Tax=Haematobia irritans TaxID=7368 RepID=UPI003F4F42E0
MKQIALICSLTMLANVVTAGDYYKIEGGRSVFIESGDDKFTWFQALCECSQRNMSLITLDSQEKSQQLYKLLKSIGLNNKFLWIGGHSFTNDGSFQWIATNKTFTYTNWDKDEPSPLLGANCVEMFSKEWFSFNCDDLNLFICEEPKDELENIRATFFHKECTGNSNFQTENEMRMSLMRINSEEVVKETHTESKCEKLEMNLKNAQQKILELEKSRDDQKPQWDEMKEELARTKIILESNDYGTMLEELKNINISLISFLEDQKALQNTREEQAIQLAQIQEELDQTKTLLHDKENQINELHDELNKLKMADISMNALLEEQISTLNNHINQTTVNRLSEPKDTYNATSCAIKSALLKAKSEELYTLKKTNELLINRILN